MYLESTWNRWGKVKYSLQQCPHCLISQQKPCELFLSYGAHFQFESEGFNFVSLSNGCFLHEGQLKSVHGFLPSCSPSLQKTAVAHKVSAMVLLLSLLCVLGPGSCCGTGDEVGDVGLISSVLSGRIVNEERGHEWAVISEMVVNGDNGHDLGSGSGVWEELGSGLERNLLGFAFVS